MVNRIRLERSEHPTLTPLFAGVPRLRAVIDSVLEGYLGRAEVDDRTTPSLAALELGCYTVLGGDPTSPRAREWVGSITGPREILFPDSEEWRSLLRDVYGPSVSDRPMQAFSSRDLQMDHLRDESRPPEGIEICRLDAKTAARLDEELEPHALQVFESPEDFEARGIGFAALIDGDPVCVATSYAVCSDSVELAIATRPIWRGRGLARSVAATFMVDCLERGLEPHWNAANPVSQGLAVRLGYRPDGICEILFLD